MGFICPPDLARVRVDRLPPAVDCCWCLPSFSLARIDVCFLAAAIAGLFLRRPVAARAGCASWPELLRPRTLKLGKVGTVDFRATANP